MSESTRCLLKAKITGIIFLINPWHAATLCDGCVHWCQLSSKTRFLLAATSILDILETCRFAATIARTLVHFLHTLPENRTFSILVSCTYTTTAPTPTQKQPRKTNQKPRSSMSKRGIKKKHTLCIWVESFVHFALGGRLLVVLRRFVEKKIMRPSVPLWVRRSPLNKRRRTRKDCRHRVTAAHIISQPSLVSIGHFFVEPSAARVWGYMSNL